MTCAPSDSGPLALLGSGEFLPANEALDRPLLAGRPPGWVSNPPGSRFETRMRPVAVGG